MTQHAALTATPAPTSTPSAPKPKRFSIGHPTAAMTYAYLCFDGSDMYIPGGEDK